MCKPDDKPPKVSTIHILMAAIMLNQLITTQIMAAPDIIMCFCVNAYDPIALKKAENACKSTKKLYKTKVKLERGTPDINTPKWMHCDPNAEVKPMCAVPPSDEPFVEYELYFCSPK